MRKLSLDKAIEKAMIYCSKMERCKFDLKQKFFKWGVTEKESEQIIARLEEGKFLNESRYIEAFVRGKYYYNKWGKVKIKYNLMLKGLEESIVDAHLDTIEDTEYEALICEQLRRKNLTLKTEDSYQRKTKLIRFAQSRGYETEIALNCVDTMVEDNFELDDE